jgi:calcineurin-like phosphoesterase family protein
MLSHIELNKVWATTLREYAACVLQGEKGPYRPISDKSLKLLEALWKDRSPLPDIGAMIEAGKEVRFWSDPHLGHQAILWLAKRSAFSNVEEMDRTIIDNFEAAAEKSDLTICVGDLSMKNPIHWHRRFVFRYGERHALVVGNHDARGARPGPWVGSGNAFASIAFSLPTSLLRSWIEAGDPTAEVDWDELPKRINFGCSHWPLAAHRLPGPGWVCLHGHIHNRPAGPLGINCSVEQIGYRPRTLQELVTTQLLQNLALRQHGLDLLPSAENDPAEGYAGI